MTRQVVAPVNEPLGIVAVEPDETEIARDGVPFAAIRTGVPVESTISLSAHVNAGLFVTEIADVDAFARADAAEVHAPAIDTPPAGYEPPVHSVPAEPAVESVDSHFTLYGNVNVCAPTVTVPDAPPL